MPLEDSSSASADSENSLSSASSASGESSGSSESSHSDTSDDSISSGSGDSEESGSSGPSGSSGSEGSESSGSEPSGSSGSEPSESSGSGESESSGSGESQSSGSAESESSGPSGSSGSGESSESSGSEPSGSSEPSESSGSGESESSGSGESQSSGSGESGSSEPSGSSGSAESSESSGSGSSHGSSESSSEGSSESSDKSSGSSSESSGSSESSASSGSSGGLEFEVLIPPIEGEEGLSLAKVAGAAAADDDPLKYIGYMTNPIAGDWKKQTFKYLSSKKLTSLTLEDNPDIQLESIEIQGPEGGTVTIKSKSAVAADGIYSVSLKFDAVAESGEQASDDMKKVQIGTTAKLALTLFSESIDFGEASLTMNGKIEVSGTAVFDGMSESVLNGSQKTTATAEWKLNVKDFPGYATLEAKASETIEGLNGANNPTVKYNAAASASMVYTNLATSIIFNGGAGYGFNFSPEHSANALSINYLSAGVEIPVNGSISIFGNAKLENLAPLGASEKSVVGAQVEVGIKMQLPIKK